MVSLQLRPARTPAPRPKVSVGLLTISALTKNKPAWRINPPLQLAAADLL
jgi:hypothetical protein